MYPLKSTLCLLALFSPLSLSVQVQAQVTPANDGTGTIVEQRTGNITGGQTTGTNLFHSFQQFDVISGQTANFVPDAGITNILGRVGGNAPSVVNGTIQVTGNANLYLMNPAGLIFGQGAVLNVPGSFVGTTANAIGFGDGKWFNAVGTNNYEALTGNPTGFAFTTAQPGSIFNAAKLEGTDPLPDAPTPGNRIGGLTLVGGAVISLGEIKIPGGNLNIATVPGGKFVRISQTGNVLSLDLPIQDLTIADKQAIQPTGITLPRPPTLSLLLTNPAVNEAGGVVIQNGVVKLTGSHQVIEPRDIVTRAINTGINLENVSLKGGDVNLVSLTGNIQVDSIDTRSDKFGTASAGGNVQLDAARLFRAVGFISNSVPNSEVKIGTGTGVSIYTGGSNVVAPEEAQLQGGTIRITHRGNSFIAGGSSSINPDNADGGKDLGISINLIPEFSFTEGASGTAGAIVSRNSNGNFRVVFKDGGFVGSNPGIADGFKITQLPPQPPQPPQPPDQTTKKSKEFCDRESSTTITTNIPAGTRSASSNSASPCQPVAQGNRILKILDK
jgi:filamentous hemagglutinin family protein